MDIFETFGTFAGFALFDDGHRLFELLDGGRPIRIRKESATGFVERIRFLKINMNFN